ncbi:archaellin/type IV pilin N-terminal domain-containing protein [Roseibium suaedae]|uniref:Flagellin N-terminal-like domain-containing protein n=1 Tax=Roseibium suaedae TaxID=735517 RepID=A0A1M7D5Z0_9HYPH|nr:archaellin/type IV pilin N-terminal domain-containing protein [Roseibium suaedae]SHL74884.1 flagellin N-terminal-like domain-containing protein [Roseibium suaedae]
MGKGWSSPDTAALAVLVVFVAALPALMLTSF